MSIIKNFKLDQYDWINIVAALIMIGAATFLATYFYEMERDECVSEPLVYGVKQIEKHYGYEAFGSVTLLIDDPTIRIPSITFSSKNITID